MSPRASTVALSVLLAGLLMLLAACAGPGGGPRSASRAATSATSATTAVALEALEQRELAEARALFDRNVAAIQARDREAYLDCYLPSERLVRTGSTGIARGFDGLAAGLTGDWPVSLRARDVHLAWLAPGLVYGSYRYHVVYADGASHEGLSERLFGPTPDGWRIVMTTAFEQPPGTPAPPVALVGATLYDGSEAEPVRDAVVLLRDGRIEAVGTRAELPVPDGVDVIDLAGHFLTPGLVDTHVHYSQTGWVDGRPDAFDVRARYPYAQVQAGLQRHPGRLHRAFLHAGITAVLDCGGFPWTRTLGAAAETSADAPHVAAAGPLLTTWDPGPALALPDQTQMVLMRDADGVRAAVASHAAQGSDAIKVWFIVNGERPLEELGALVAVAGEAARAHELPLIVHATGLAEARLAVAAGAALLVHSVEDAPVDEAFLAACLEQGTAYCPTLTVRAGYDALFERRVPDALRARLPALDASVRERLLETEGLPPDPRDTPDMRARRAGRTAAQATTMAGNLLALHEAGVPVVLGTDAGNPLTPHGASLGAELAAMQAAGLSPRAVLTAATRDAARAIGRGEDLGLVAPGRIADLLVLSADPGADVAAFGALEWVVRGGVLHRRALLAAP
jgi:imidazolonepropionase-like amidohydrolase